MAKRSHARQSVSGRRTATRSAVASGPTKTERTTSDPVRKKLKLAPSVRRSFLKLVDDVNSRDNATRVVGRLRMTRFIAKHSREACDEFYAAYEARLKARMRK